MRRSACINQRAAAGSSRRHRSPDRRQCAGGQALAAFNAGGTTFRRDPVSERQQPSLHGIPGGRRKRHQRTVFQASFTAASESIDSWCERGGRTTTPAGALQHTLSDLNRLAERTLRYADRQAAGDDRRPGMLLDDRICSRRLIPCCSTMLRRGKPGGGCWGDRREYRGLDDDCMRARRWTCATCCAARCAPSAGLPLPAGARRTVNLGDGRADATRRW